MLSVQEVCEATHTGSYNELRTNSYRTYKSFIKSLQGIDKESLESIQVADKGACDEIVECVQGTHT